MVKILGVYHHKLLLRFCVDHLAGRTQAVFFPVSLFSSYINVLRDDPIRAEPDEDEEDMFDTSSSEPEGQL